MKIKALRSESMSSSAEGWLVVGIDPEAKIVKVIQSDWSEERAERSAHILNEHNQRYGHKMRFYVYKRADVEVLCI